MTREDCDDSDDRNGTQIQDAPRGFTASDFSPPGIDDTPTWPGDADEGDVDPEQRYYVTPIGRAYLDGNIDARRLFSADDVSELPPMRTAG